jgi:type VI secretion system secreted protein Hcp
MKDIYVQFKGKYAIEGETRDVDHAANKCLEVTSWAHNIRQPKSATSSTAGGHTSERCEHADMVFTKDMDKTSTKLWEACSAGYTFDEVIIDFMRADGGKRFMYLQIKLKNVIISEVTPSVLSEGIPTETFKLKYAAVSWVYDAQKIEGASSGGKFPTAWSLSKNNNSYTV